MKWQSSDDEPHTQPKPFNRLNLGVTTETANLKQLKWPQV
jgi:hypothetical protein